MIPSGNSDLFEIFCFHSSAYGAGMTKLPKRSEKGWEASPSGPGKGADQSKHITHTYLGAQEAVVKWPSRLECVLVWCVVCEFGMKKFLCGQK